MFCHVEAANTIFSFIAFAKMKLASCSVILYILKMKDSLLQNVHT